MQAMIFAAGMGTRLKPITDNMPKALVPVGGEPLIKHVVKRLQAAGVQKMVVNVHHFADMLCAYLEENKNFGTDISISDERQMLLDTGGGLKHAARFFMPSEPILIHNVDILSNASLEKLYAMARQDNGEGHLPEAVLLVSERETSRYLLFDNDMHLVGWLNKNTGEVKSPYLNLQVENCKQLAFSGIHVFNPTLFGAMETFGERFSIIDFYLQVCAHHVIKGVIQPDLKLLDVGKLNSLEAAEHFFA